MRWGILLMAAVCLPAVAHADARGELDAGIAAYDAGRFREAAQHFSDAYALDPRPTLLFNQAQAWRRDHESTGDPITRRRALELYRIFVAQPQISDAERLEASVHLKELEANPVVVAPPSPAPVVVAPPPPPPPKRRTGLWVGVGVGVALVVGALAVGLGVGLSQPAPESPKVTGRW